MPKHRPWMPGVCVYRPYTTELNVIYWYLWKAARNKQARNLPFMSQQELARVTDKIIADMMGNVEEEE